MGQMIWWRNGKSMEKYPKEKQLIQFIIGIRVTDWIKKPLSLDIT